MNVGDKVKILTGRGRGHEGVIKEVVQGGYLVASANTGGIVGGSAVIRKAANELRAVTPHQPTKVALFRPYTPPTRPLTR